MKIILNLSNFIIMIKDLMKCIIIGLKMEKNLKPSLDHIIPISQGGKSCFDNFQILTWFENRCKNDMTQEEWDKIKNNIWRYFR